jgi:hypothetical protein
VAKYLWVFRHVGFFCSWHQEAFATITWFQNHRKGLPMGLILLIILILLLMGGLPTWGYSRNWGYGPSSGLGLVVVIVLVLLLMGYIPRSF